MSFQIEVICRNEENQKISFHIPFEQSADCEEEKEFSIFEDDGLHQFFNTFNSPGYFEFNHSKIKYISKLSRGFCYCWSPPPWC